MVSDSVVAVTLAVVSTFTHHVGLLERQQNQDVIVYPASCFALADAAILQAQDIGQSPDVCQAGSAFQNAVNDLRACVSSSNSTGTVATSEAINQYLLYCADLSSSPSSSSPASSLTSLPVASTLTYTDISGLPTLTTASSYISALPTLTTASSTSSVYDLFAAALTLDAACSAASAPAITLVQFQTATNLTSIYSCPPTASSPTVPPIEPDARDLSTGGLAGIVVGAVVGGMLIVVVAGLFAWRHRKQKKLRAQQVPLTAEEQPEIAQLHGDDYQPPREEMPGSKVPQKVRVVGGISELGNNETNKPRHGRMRSELSANEIAASEMRGDLSPSTDASTLIGSSMYQSIR